MIGAGLSGLACASALETRNFDVRVFDKGRSPGGRISTRRADIQGAEVDFDHGAQYFTCRDSRLAALVASFEKLGVVERWDGRIVAIGEGGRFDPSGSKIRFVGTPAMSAVCKHLASSQNVSCGVTVGAVVSDARGTQVLDIHGQSLGVYDVVVCTAPPTQTASLLRQVAPSIAARAAAVRMKPCWAVMAAFDSPLDVPFDGAFINVGPLSWMARTSSKPSRPTTPDRWVLHAGAPWSTEHLEEMGATVTQALLYACFEVIGRSVRAPVWARAHRWRYALAENALDVGCLFDSSNRILACGDWTNGNRVEGALLSGLAAARHVRRTWESGGEVTETSDD